MSARAPFPVPYWRQRDSRPSLAKAPAVLLAAMFTAGILVDRIWQVSLGTELLCAGVALVAWSASQFGRTSKLALVYLGFAFAGLGAAYHHHWRNDAGPLDISRIAHEGLQPIQVRGLICQEPVRIEPAGQDELRSMPMRERYTSVLAVTEVRIGNAWMPSAGRVRLGIRAKLQGIHQGDEVEVVGRLQGFGQPMNPGEKNWGEYFRDHGLHAQITVVRDADAVTRLEPGSAWSITRVLVWIRGSGARILERYLPPEQTGVAQALLLGEESAMPGADWDRYIRTGVVHVLSVSGQHLAILAGCLWFLCLVANVPRQRAAIFVTVFLFAYALVTGMQAPVLRSVVMVTIVCGGFLLRRSVLAINSLALAWLAVLVVNPADAFSAGCQLSFLSVILLFWGPARLPRREEDPLNARLRASRPRLLRLGSWLGTMVLESYLVCAVITLLLMPLIAFHYHLISWQGILIGPPVVFFGTIALVSGFLLIAVGGFVPILAVGFAWITRTALTCCEGCVNWADHLRGSGAYLPDIPVWWVVCFYAGLLACLFLPRQGTLRFLIPSAGIAWVILGLVLINRPQAGHELRCAFLAVGHGGCVVLETPDRRVLVYDIGALSGPEVTRQRVAPYLWSRGISRIDSVLLSHADLDHFNGLSELLDRFAVSQVIATPTFATKSTRGVEAVLDHLKKKGCELQVVARGDRLQAGAVEIEVLHPSELGPAGNENARSLVLCIRHAGHAILLTGDLEGAGQAEVLALPSQPIDVLMAPHHGSRTANDARLANWARPKAVVSCEGPPRNALRPPEPYTARSARFFGTWPHGAVTVRSTNQAMLLETFATGERVVLERGGDKGMANAKPGLAGRN